MPRFFRKEVHHDQDTSAFICVLLLTNYSSRDLDVGKIAAANGFADLPHIPPEQDRITKQLPELHFYQLAIPAPAPEPGVD